VIPKFDVKSLNRAEYSEHSINRVSVLIEKNTCILSLRKVKRYSQHVTVCENRLASFALAVVC
jgi:hypothetical protein